MNVNVNHPTYILFLDNVTNGILSNVTVNTYFSVAPEKKIKVQYIVLKLMKNLIKSRGKFSDPEIKSFILILMKKNEENENFELAAILRDISNNFDTVNELSKPVKKPMKVIKTDTTENNQPQ
jgi:hypothetical protein